MIQFPEFNQVNVFTGFADLGRVSDLIKKHLGGYNIYTPNVDYQQGTLTIERTCVEGNWHNNMFIEGYETLPLLYSLLFVRKVFEKIGRIDNNLFLFTQDNLPMHMARLFEDRVFEGRVSYFLVSQNKLGIFFKDVTHTPLLMFRDRSYITQLVALDYLHLIESEIKDNLDNYLSPK